MEKNHDITLLNRQNSKSIPNKLFLYYHLMHLPALIFAVDVVNRVPQLAKLQRPKGYKIFSPKWEGP